MFSAIAALTVLGLTLGYALGLASRYLKVEANPIVEEIEAILPGSQCGQCGFPGCSGAAQALAKGEAPVTLCPPGGRSLAETLAGKLGVQADLSAMGDGPSALARVSEGTCIGCTRCFKVCPTDAIVGAPKQIHVVIQQACTACGKCVEVCPTECLQLQPVPATLQTWRWPKPALAA
ncbi:MAG: RnfABCDGE type electron transport complex subunit B [Gammaproteobacteria bacterium]